VDSNIIHAGGVWVPESRARTPIGRLHAYVYTWGLIREPLVGLAFVPLPFNLGPPNGWAASPAGEENRGGTRQGADNDRVATTGMSARLPGLKPAEVLRALRRAGPFFHYMKRSHSF